MTEYATMGDIFRRARSGLRESSWVPVVVYCPHGCFVGNVHQTIVGGIWNPKDSGLSERTRKLAGRMSERTDIDWDAPLEDAATQRTLRLMSFGLPPFPIPLDAFKDDDVAPCECRAHGSSVLTAAELRAKFAEATTPPTRVIKMAATAR